MPSMTEVVDRLVAEGFVERVRDTDDRRVVKVQLTDRGRNAHDGILEARVQELQHIFGGLDEKERMISSAIESMKGVKGKKLIVYGKIDPLARQVLEQRGWSVIEEKPAGGL